jgi:glutamate/tyrosine decarboxylase-like PLP-dependent enzyme
VSREPPAASPGAIPPDGFDLDRATMRRMGYAVVDLLVQRWATLGEQPPWRAASRAEMEARLREPVPEAGVGAGGFDALLHRTADEVLEYAGRIDHPRFVAFIPSSPTWGAVLGDMLTAGYNVFQGTWLESAGPSEIELLVIDWFKGWLGYPGEAGGLLLSGGSAANLTALVVARDSRLGGPDPAGVLYASDQVHSSVDRAARILGFDPGQLRLVPCDDAFRLDPAALEAAIREDAAVGRRPFCVVANAGATSTGAIDPLPAMADICRRHGLWLHADGAYGGFAALTDRGRHWLAGIERADSITLDPHKWLFQTYEAGCLLVRDARVLARSFHVMPDYLRDTAVLGSEVNFADRGLELTRTTRALKIWLSLQLFGAGAFRHAIDGALDLAAGAQRRIEASPRLELLSPAALGIVCFRRRPHALDPDTDALNERILQRLNRNGIAMMSSTRIRGCYALRLCIMNWRTTADDVARILDAVESDAPLE